MRKTKHYRQLVSSCPALASPALFWFCLAHAQRVPESSRSRGGFRDVSFSHLQRTRQGREAGRPHCGQDGFRQGTKRSDAPTLGLLTLRPRRKGFLPLKLREALRKSGRLPAFNFPSRPVLGGHNRPPSPSPPPLPAARLPWVPRPTRPRPAAICPMPSSRPGLPAGPQAATIATCPRAGPPAVGCSGSGRPFKWKPLSPTPGMPYSACGRTAPPCPAPHRNESGRAARSAPPRGAVCTLPPRPFALQQLPRRMV